MAPLLLLSAVYDVTRRDSFEELESVWMREVDLHSNVECAIRMVVANKVDLVREWRCLFVSCVFGLPTALCGLCVGVLCLVDER